MFNANLTSLFQTTGQAPEQAAFTAEPAAWTAWISSRLNLLVLLKLVCHVIILSFEPAVYCLCHLLSITVMIMKAIRRYVMNEHAVLEF